MAEVDRAMRRIANWIGGMLAALRPGGGGTSRVLPIRRRRFPPRRAFVKPRKQFGLRGTGP
jgi:hypothetical protein